MHCYIVLTALYSIQIKSLHSVSFLNLWGILMKLRKFSLMLVKSRYGHCISTCEPVSISHLLQTYISIVYPF